MKSTKLYPLVSGQHSQRPPKDFSRAGILVVMACVVFGLSGNPSLGADRTSFVIILSDDLGYGDLGCYGHPHIKTPHLDKLAGQGWRLTDCYAAAPVCSPSRAGLLTGRIPNRLGIYDWIPERSPMHLRSGEITVASLLKTVGYQTAHVGKWHCNGHFNSTEQPQPSDHGFDHWFSTQNNAAPSHRNPVNFVRNGQPAGPLEGYSSQIIVDESIEWLRNLDRSKPFLLLVWLHSPHEPVATANPFTDQYLPMAVNSEQAEYFGNVTQLDHEIGRLLKSLDDDHLSETTFVYFSSDNGPETLNRYRGSERSYGTAGSLRGMKLHLYEGGIRVPGILRWPTHTVPGRTISEPVISLDLLPTICAIAGTKPPVDRPLDGISLLPLFAGDAISRNKPLYWQYDRAQGGLNRVAIRTGDWKLLANANLTTFELYNLRKDPSETDNLVTREPVRVAELTQQLKQLHADVKAEEPVWPEGPGTGQRNEK